QEEHVQLLTASPQRRVVGVLERKNRIELIPCGLSVLLTLACQAVTLQHGGFPIARAVDVRSQAHEICLVESPVGAEERGTSIGPVEITLSVAGQNFLKVPAWFDEC